jgi:predicted nucleotidyltransferase
VAVSKTARELTAKELGSFEPGARISVWRNDPVRQEREHTAWDAARAAAVLLKGEFCAERVVVFGSLANSDRFTPWSDVDLVVSGVEPRRFYDAAGEVLDLGSGFGIRIDVLDLDACPPEFRRAVEAEGIEI